MFEKNLEYINNPALKRRLLRVTTQESREGVTYCITPSNDYVLLKNDVPTDDINNPRESIRKMLKFNIRQEMKPNDIIINFGIGLGYLLDETFNTFPSKIYIYEPDLALLHFVLSNVDISEHLSSGRVYITNDLDELINRLSETFITKDKVEIVFIQNYAVVRNKELLLLTQKVYETCKSKMVDISTIAKFSQVWLANALENIAAFKEKPTYLLSDLNNKYVGQTALIAGAGPSLADNIKNIQQNRNKFTIFAVNKSVKYLLQNGITPDFTVALDAKNLNKTLDLQEEDLARMNCIIDLRTDKTVIHKAFRKVFVTFSSSDNIAKKLTNYNKFIRLEETGGTAATLGLISAIKMGFSKILLAGVDLAFKDNVTYASGEIMNRISQEQILAEGVKKNLVQVPSVNGGMVYTRDDYQAFINHFATIIKDTGYSEVYNLSSFGAYIEGVKNTNFEELNLFAPAVMISHDSLQPLALDTKEFIQEEFGNINEIISLLSKGVFSPALVSSIVKSVFVYQYMQAEIVNVLQRNFEPQLAEEFITKTKSAIRYVVEILQRNKLI